MRELTIRRLRRPVGRELEMNEIATVIPGGLCWDILFLSEMKRTRKKGKS